MGIVLTVVLSWPFHDISHLSQVLVIFEALLGVSWNVNSRDTGQLSGQHRLVHGVVNRDDSGASGLQVIRMGWLEEALVGRLEVIVPLCGQWLGENTKDWLIVLWSHVMTDVWHDWLTLVTAQVISSVATYCQRRESFSKNLLSFAVIETHVLYCSYMLQDQDENRWRHQWSSEKD